MSVKKNKGKIEKADKRILLLWLAMGIVPLIVMLIINSCSLGQYDWFSNTETEPDFFLTYKMYGVIAVLCAMLCLMSFDMYKGNKSFDINGKLAAVKHVLAVAGIYSLLCLVSAAFAQDKGAAFGGGYAQHESVLALLGYIMIMIFAYCYMNNMSTFMMFYRLFVIATGVMAVIGLGQFFEMDLFNSSMGKSIITMFTDIDPDRISLKFEPGTVYMTLYNPNYVGTYVALVLPFIVAGLYVMKQLWEKIMCGIVAVMLVICLIGSDSTTGIIAIAVSALVLLAIALCGKVNNKKNVLITALAVIAVLGAVAGINHDKISQAIDKYIVSQDDFGVTSMELQEDGVEIVFRGETLKLSYNGEDGSGVRMTNEAGEELPLQYNGLVLENTRLEDGSAAFAASYGTIRYTFTNDNQENKYYFCNPYGKLTDNVVNADRVLFNNYERFASGRGYIWSRSIALLKDNLLIGCGPDNFIYEFPNNDYVSLYNNEYYSQIVTRPHNMYLQVGVQTGVVSMILFILLYVIYFIQCVRIYTKECGDKSKWLIGVTIFVGTFGYMICGLANDSTICVAPVFWGMLGIGYAINYLVFRESADLKKNSK